MAGPVHVMRVTWGGWLVFLNGYFSFFVGGWIRLVYGFFSVVCATRAAPAAVAAAIANGFRAGRILLFAARTAAPPGSPREHPPAARDCARDPADSRRFHRRSCRHSSSRCGAHIRGCPVEPNSQFTGKWPKNKETATVWKKAKWISVVKMQLTLANAISGPELANHSHFPWIYSHGSRVGPPVCDGRPDPS